MARILFVTARPPYPLHQGMALRVFHLAREASRCHEVHLAARGLDAGTAEALAASGVFAGLLPLPALAGPPARSRFLFPLGHHLLRRYAPDQYRRTVASLGAYVRQEGITHAVAVTLPMAEMIAPLAGPRKIVDEYDCASLTMERRLRQDGAALGARGRLRQRLALSRIRHQETRLARTCHLVTTISPADAAALSRLSGRLGERVRVLANGVGEEWLREPPAVREEERAVAFWGALDFEPNQRALRFFFDQVYRPFLAEAGITWHVMGKNPPAWLQAMAGHHPGLRLRGFVPDLVAEAARIPLAVNPMQSGSGLKNKVLEAFSLRRLVISSRLGMEAIEALPGEHYLPADSPQEMARLIRQHLDSCETRRRIGDAARRLVQERYTWERIGQRFLVLLQEAQA
ncbi:MAG: glycosyltransferase [Thermodesulfobacteriota bacterium]